MRAILRTAPLLLVLTACLSDLPPTDRLGFVTLQAVDNGGTPVVRGQAVFYRTSGLQFLPLQPQACGLYGYQPPTSGGSAGRTLNAGPQVSFTVAGFSENAIPAPNATYPVYNFPAGTYLDFSAGDSVLVNIPGATGGFEPMSGKVRLAEAFTAGAIPAFVPNTDMELTWSAPPAAGSLMLVSLRYNATLGAAQPNVEISCAFADDGTGTIPSTYANGWGTAEPASRQYTFTRVREAVVSFDDRTRTRIRSIFEVPAISLNAAP